MLAPSSIAVIGASRDAGTIGHQILLNILRRDFTGAVYPVNPKARAICSVRAYPTIADVPERVDLGVVVVPKQHVLDVADQCADAGVRSLVVISAGFKETGGAGIEHERRLAELVRRNGIRMLGPNCMGVINTDRAISMNATFATAMPPYGHSAFVSQSGALGVSVLDYAREYGIGIAQFVSVGNKADVSSNDLLREWEHDPAIGVILMYVENFGNPRRFLEIASRITKTKPIIAVKAGRSRSGARAASSHTGALAASDSAVDALLTQAGVLRAASIEELFDMAMGFGVAAVPRSRRTAVLTNAGGPGILAADALETCGLEMVELSPSTVEELRPLFPAEASIGNPLDMIASATPAGYKTALAALLADPLVDAVVPIFVPPFGVKQADVAEAIVAAASTAPGKPVLSVLMGRDGLPEGRAELHEAGIPAYIFPESAARALAALNRQREWAERPAPRVGHLDVDRDAAAAIIAGARRTGRQHLTALEAIELARAYGIPVAASRLAVGAHAVAEAARDVGFPLVLKVESPDILHKTDVGGVHVGISSEAEARVAYDLLMRNVRQHRPAASITGVLVQHMLAGGRELIAGVARDSKFGPLVMFGLGGIFVEAMRDVIFRVTPLDDVEALAMIDGIRGTAMLNGNRGEPPVDKHAIADVLRRLAQLADDFSEIEELDINPLLGFSTGAVAADIRVRLGTAG
jgi:acetyltransferase